MYSRGNGLRWKIHSFNLPGKALMSLDIPSLRSCVFPGSYSFACNECQCRPVSFCGCGFPVYVGGLDMLPYFCNYRIMKNTTKKSTEQVAKFADMFSAMGTEARLRIMQL